MTLSEQLDTAMSIVPPDDRGLIVRVVRLNNAARPGQEAQGVLPVFVVGHEATDAKSWARWIRENAVAHYGPAMAEKFLANGIDLKEMDPTRAFGRSLRSTSSWKSEANQHYVIDNALYLLTLVEKWPSLYNLIATEMAEEDMTLGEFVDRLFQLPSPREVGEGRYSTLGDLIGRNVVLTPNY